MVITSSLSPVPVLVRETGLYERCEQVQSLLGCPGDEPVQLPLHAPECDSLQNIVSQRRGVRVELT